MTDTITTKKLGQIWARAASKVCSTRLKKLSPLEGDGFELPVPRAMQARLKAKIAGFACMRSLIIWGCRFRAR
jgi:hypothetical protein